MLTSPILMRSEVFYGKHYSFSLNTLVPSHLYNLYKMEAKVDINPYQGDIDVVKLNHWLQQLEVYFNVHNIDEE